MANIGIEQIQKVYANGFEAVRDVTLDVADGEFMVLVGPSGCGKTTLLRMVAGLEDVTSGTVSIGGRVVNDLDPKDRDIAMVFQNYALYPNMTVAENIGWALKLRKMPKAEIRTKVAETAAVLGLTDWLDRKPGQLSGGQRQRVAMGRAIIREPAAFLMDEPLSNLDAKLRVAMRAEVSRVQRRLGVATLYVTHDQIEAMTMGDRVAVMQEGSVQQCDAPQELYDHPANVFVAAFIGSPSMNLYRASLDEGARTVRVGSQTVPLPDRIRIGRPGLAAFGDKRVVVGLRPEHLSAATGQDRLTLEGDITMIEALGNELLVHFVIDADVYRPGGIVDDEDRLDNRGEGVARVSARSPMTVGAKGRFAVDIDGLQFFDPTTGEAV